MSSRVGGAVALAAAALLAVSMLTSWWSGHPTVEGHEQEAKAVFTGLLGATGCNTGGDGSCQSLTELLRGGFKTTAFVEFMLIGVASLIAIALGIASLLANAVRRPLARLVLIACGLVVVGAIALRIQGPDFKVAEVSTNFDLGLMLFALGVASAGVASWLALRVVVPRPFFQPVVAAPAPAPGFDVNSLFAEDQLRPAALGPEPMLGRPPHPLGPGGPLAGPSGPLAAPGSPLFQSAPQLRPLYEAAGDGMVPHAEPPVFPPRPPTPIPRGSIGAVLGIPTPPAVDAQRSKPPTLPPPLLAPPPPAHVASTRSTPLDGARAKPSTLPPPTRSRTSSSAPPIPRPTSIGVAAGPAPEPNFDEPLQPMPAIPSPSSPKIPRATKPHATIASAVVPAPPAIVPPVVPSLFPPRMVTDADPNAAQTAEEAASTVGDATDASIQNFPADDASSPEGGTAEERAASHDEMLEPRDERGDVPGDGTDEAETRARERASARELGLTTSDFTRPVDRDESVITSTPPPSQMPEDESQPPGPPRMPTVVPTLTSIARALRSHARAERERDRTSTNLQAAPERTDGEHTPPPQRTSAPVAAQRASAQIPARRASAQVPAQRASAQVAAQRASAQVPAQRASARISAARTSAQVSAQNEPAAESPRAPAQLPITTAPSDLAPPSETQAQTSGPSPACPQCESPMAWVEEHLRFYCKSCRMYF